MISATFNPSFLECWPFQIIQNFRDSSRRYAINNQSKARARRTLANVDSGRRVTLYPEGHPERTFVSNGVLVKCSSLQRGVRYNKRAVVGCGLTRAKPAKQF